MSSAAPSPKHPFLFVASRVVGPFAENSYLIACPETREAAYIDPGEDPDELADLALSAGYTPRFIINTHAHIDHIGAVAPLMRRFCIPFYLHPGDAPVLEAAPLMASMFGMGELELPSVTTPLSDRQTFTLGTLTIEVRATPGHSPGGVAFVVTAPSSAASSPVTATPVVFSGDALFQGSIGRTDLPGGNYRTLMQSIREQILTLPDATLIYSGHGPLTTVGEERVSNPFINGQFRG